MSFTWSISISLGLYKRHKLFLPYSQGCIHYRWIYFFSVKFSYTKNIKSYKKHDKYKSINKKCTSSCPLLIYIIYIYMPTCLLYQIDVPLIVTEATPLFYKENYMSTSRDLFLALYKDKIWENEVYNDHSWSFMIIPIMIIHDHS